MARGPREKWRVDPGNPFITLQATTPRNQTRTDAQTRRRPSRSNHCPDRNCGSGPRDKLATLARKMTVESMRLNRNGSVRAKLDSHGHVVLCFLVMVTIYVCGCASGRPEISWGIGGPNLWKEASSAAYPAARTFCGRKTDDPSAYYCVVVRLSAESGWKLQRAWRAGPGGRVMEEYPVR